MDYVSMIYLFEDVNFMFQHLHFPTSCLNWQKAQLVMGFPPPSFFSPIKLFYDCDTLKPRPARGILKCTYLWSANLLNSPFCLCLNVGGFINNSKATLTQFSSKIIYFLWHTKKTLMDLESTPTHCQSQTDVLAIKTLCLPSVPEFQSAS